MDSSTPKGVGSSVVALSLEVFKDALGQMNKEATSHQSRLALFGTLKSLQSDLKAKADAVTRVMEGLKEPILEAFIDIGQTSAKVDGTTIYIHRQLWANAAVKLDATGEPTSERDWQGLCQGLVEAGASHLVPDAPHPNVQSLSAWVRELPTDEDGNPDLPVCLVGRIAITREPDLRTRGASKR